MPAHDFHRMLPKGGTHIKSLPKVGARVPLKGSNVRKFGCRQNISVLYVFHKTFPEPNKQATAVSDERNSPEDRTVEGLTNVRLCDWSLVRVKHPRNYRI
jgi:hypothetical protein